MGDMVDDPQTWRAALASMDLPACASDGEGRLVFFNAAAVRLWGCAPAKDARWCDGLNMYRRGQPVDAATCILAQCIREGRNVEESDIEVVAADGTRKRVTLQAVPVMRNGSAVGAFAFAYESVSRRDLELVRGRLTAIVQSSDDAIVSTDLDGVITSWNAGASRLYGYSAEEVIGQPVSILIPECQGDEEPEVLARVRRGVVVDHYETYRRRKDGSQVAVSLSVSPMVDESGVIVGASKIARDVSESYAADMVRSQLAAIVESSSDAIVSKDLTGRIVTWNRGAERVFGYAASEVIGKPITILIPFERLDEEPEVLRRIARGESIEHFETVRRHKNGSLLDISLTVSPIRDRQGKIVGASKIARDISDRKYVERQLALADQRKDEFLATLSHELRNPLAPLRTSIDFLSANPETSSSSQRSLEVMRRQVDHLVHLVDDLLEISRISRGTITLKTELLALGTILQDAIDISRPLIDSRNHHLDVSIHEKDLMVSGDRVRLVQVFSNLLNNAAKFTEPGGAISVSLQSDSESALVRIQDTGIGLPAGELSSIFEMFTRLKSESSGLGVGLSLVKSIVEMHGGTVAVRSEGVGQGSTFTVRLPVQVSPLEHVRAAGVPAVDPPPTRRLLVVDDNRDAAEALSALLTLLGHDVSVAYDGMQALAACEQSVPEIALLDIGLPGMSGYDLAQAMRDRPWGEGITLVALTGWGQAGDQQRAQEAGFDHHLVKPVHVQRLLQLLQEPRRIR
ncbi:PAS/PAC sensor hybrid histidine kinase [Panacagrimonas perspica]|uniref:histidine kinase n=2 Tax=Panacagrimonas perspica TaxID=381431 RepID=A0A4V3F4L4_9GAMM|nr:PAS domain S-box protein [Panacagrimonas perspica]TDU25536.1 PAS/PAC sensor hybrid histidine kinase [Panacagrimonas perspica]THD03858.1 hypothetical protein B1810_08315 [Panacagrimonas perspica]